MAQLFGLATLNAQAAVGDASSTCSGSILGVARGPDGRDFCEDLHIFTD